jgi:F-type H+-transporting ATPase subunit epsilon
MSNKLLLEIITPNGLIFSGHVNNIRFPGEEGEFGVLPEHTSIFTLLKGGIIEFTKENGSIEALVINAGNVTVDKTSVIALVDGAVAIEGKGSDIAKSLNNIRELLKDFADSNLIIASVESRLS